MGQFRLVKFTILFSLVFVLVLTVSSQVFADDIRHNSTFNPEIEKKKHRFRSGKHSFRNHRHHRFHKFHGNHHLDNNRKFRIHNKFRTGHRFNHPLHRAFELRNGTSTQLHPVAPLSNPRVKFVPHHHRHRFHR